MNLGSGIVLGITTEKICRALHPRIRFLLPFVISASLVWLALIRLRPALQESDLQARELGELLGRVKQSESTVVESDSSGLTPRVTSILSTLMTNETEVIHWLKAAELTANDLGWRIRHDIGEIETRGAGKFETQRIPLRLVLCPDSSRTNRPAGGHQLLQMGAWIAQNPHRLDIVGISVSAPDAAIREATISIRLWMGPLHP